MRRVLALLAAVGMCAAACGGSGADRPAPEAGAVTESTTTPATSPPATTLPATSTTVVGGDEDPAMAALRLINDQWSTIQLWGDGWVRISTTASGAPIESRDSDFGRLFPPEVHDALEATGATDMVSAYEALGSAGLLDVALAVLRENPDAWDVVFAGPGTLRMTSEITSDGVTWTEQPMPFIGPGDVLAADSTGERLALVLGDRMQASDLVVATTDDLVEWRVDVLPATVWSAPDGLRVAPVAGGWLVLFDADRAWWFGPDGLEPVTVPTERGCCLVDDTDAGVVAAAGTGGGEAEVWFSPDGRDWEPRPAPPGDPVTLASVDGGVLLTAAVDPGRWEVWRAAADPTGWEPVVLPAEIPWPVAFWDEHHRGVTRRVVPPGWGQRGYTGPQPAGYEFAVDHDGIHVGFAVDLEGGTIRVTATDVAGETIYDRTGPGGGAGPPDFVVFGGPDTDFLDERGAVVFTVPAEIVNEAAVAAMTAAQQDVAAGFTPARRAMEEGRYLLVSTDGIVFSSVIAPSSEGDGAVPWTFAAPMNGGRGLVWVGADELDVVTLVG